MQWTEFVGSTMSCRDYCSVYGTAVCGSYRQCTTLHIPCALQCTALCQMYVCKLSPLSDSMPSAHSRSVSTLLVNAMRCTGELSTWHVFKQVLSVTVSGTKPDPGSSAMQVPGKQTGCCRDNCLIISLQVDPFLQVEGHANVFAIGDANNVKETKLGYLATMQVSLQIF